jgi:hypothetical protein
MCMITVVPAGITPPMVGIKNGGLANDHGHGWAVARGNDLLVGKSMFLEEAMDDYDKALTELGHGALSLFHSRYATHGVRGLYNVHPFYVGKSDDTVLAHNGVLPFKYRPDWKDKEDQRSDTHFYADIAGALIANGRGIPSLRTAARIAQDVGKNNKLVFLSVRSGKARIRLINGPQGVHSDGVWYSNSAWEMPPRWPGAGSLAQTRTTVYGGTGVYGSHYVAPTKPPSDPYVSQPVSHYPSAAALAKSRREAEEQEVLTKGTSATPGLVQPAQRQFNPADTPAQRLAKLRQKWGWDDEDGNPTDLDPDVRARKERAKREEGRQRWAAEQQALRAAAAPGPVGSEVVRWTDEPVEVSSTDPDACVRCRGVVDELGYCISCGVCQDCLAEGEGCYCFSPARLRAQSHLPDGYDWAEDVHSNVTPLFQHAESNAWAQE